MLTRLQAQLALLTQPRHIDSISRRLKLLLSDLDRIAAARAAAARRQRDHSPTKDSSGNALLSPTEQLQPVLTRLTPLLPHIPHILARLRTLSALHESAAEFNATLEALEAEQQRVRNSLEQMDGAMTGIEKNLEENRGVVGQNIKGLEDRVGSLVERIESIAIHS